MREGIQHDPAECSHCAEERIEEIENAARDLVEHFDPPPHGGWTPGKATYNRKRRDAYQRMCLLLEIEP